MKYSLFYGEYFQLYAKRTARRCYKGKQLFASSFGAFQHTILPFLFSVSEYLRFGVSESFDILILRYSDTRVYPVQEVPSKATRKITAPQPKYSQTTPLLSRSFKASDPIPKVV